MTASDRESEAPFLTVGEARKLPLRVLQDRYWEVTNYLHLTTGPERLPVDFPYYLELEQIGLLTRPQILEDVVRFAYWYDPRGGHRVPPPPPYHVFKMGFLWPEGASDAPKLLPLKATEFDEALVEAETIWRSAPHGDRPDGYCVLTLQLHVEFWKYERGPKAGTSNRQRLSERPASS